MRDSLFLPLFLLWSLTFALFTPSLSGDFLLDDRVYIQENEALRAPGNWLRAFYDSSVLTSHKELSGQRYRPLVALYYRALFRASGENPFGYHLLAAAIHALNACLVWLLAAMVLGSQCRAGPWGAALLFAFHPAQAESVSYIANASSLLSLSLVLVSLLLYLGPRRRTGPALTAFGLSLLCRETAVVLPVLILTLEWVRSPDRRPELRRWLVFAGLAGGYLALRTAVLGHVSGYPPWGGGWLMHYQFAVHGLFEVVGLALWPADLRTCYSFPLSASFTPAVLAKGSALLIGMSACLYGVCKKRVWAMGPLWFFISLLPTSNLLPQEALAGVGYLYLPLCGLAVGWGWALERLKRRWTGRLGRGAAPGCAAALALFLGFRSLGEQMPWQNQFRLDLAAHAAAPADPCTGINLAVHYLNWRMPARALELIRPAQAPAAAPYLQDTAATIEAVARLRSGRRPEAIRVLERALARHPAAKNLRPLLEFLRRRPGERKSGN